MKLSYLSFLPYPIQTLRQFYICIIAVLRDFSERDVTGDILAELSKIAEIKNHSLWIVIQEPTDQIAEELRQNSVRQTLLDSSERVFNTT